jgi:O-antigen/teichoic acid export membrane protein
VLRGVGWMMANQATGQVVAFITSIAIARLLMPHEVGEASEAIVFGSLALTIGDFGVATVIVQRPMLTEEDKATAFWVAMGLGVALTLLGVGLSWPISLLYGQPEVQPLFAVLSLNFLFTAPGIVPGALITRDLKFRALEVRTMIAVGASCVTSITLAALGFGPWAIIVGALVIAGVSTILLWRSTSWRPSWRFSRASLLEMREFAGHTVGSQMLTWAQSNLDNLLIGGVIGAAAVGAYSIAFAAALTPLNRIAAPITQVFFPAFSRMEDPRRIAAVWLRALRLIAFVVVPLMLGLVVISKDFVLTVFGHKWHAAVVPMQLLAPIGLMQALTALSQGIFQSIGNGRLLWRSTAAVSAISVAAFAVGLPGGISGVALAYLVASLIMQPGLMVITARAIDVPLRDVAGSLSGVLQAGLGMMAIVFGAREGLIALDVPTGARLAALIVVGALAYVPLVLWRAPAVRAELTDVARRRGGGDEPAPPTAGMIRLSAPESGAALVEPPLPRP